MKDKLEVGMYVRTEKGIAKIIDRILEPDNYYFKMWVTDKYLEINDDTEYISEIDVIKASHNIIDLIEVGDYVNGHKVYDDFRLDTDDFGIDFIEIGVESDKFLHHYIRKEDIKSIVTKEQMEQMAYKVVE